MLPSACIRHPATKRRASRKPSRVRCAITQLKSYYLQREEAGKDQRFINNSLKGNMSSGHSDLRQLTICNTRDPDY